MLTVTQAKTGLLCACCNSRAIVTISLDGAEGEYCIWHTHEALGKLLNIMIGVPGGIAGWTR